MRDSLYINEKTQTGASLIEAEHTDIAKLLIISFGNLLWHNLDFL